jgi:TonB family protein
VRVAIDPEGVVRDADLVTKDVDDHLGRSAVEAARLWKFEPARVEDRPVASSLVVRFQLGANREIRKITPLIVGSISDYRLFLWPEKGTRSA